MTQPYQFKPHERPVIPGSPFNPDHTSYRMWAYGAIAVLAGLTGGLGNALVTANLAFFQGTLGLTAEEAAWIPAAYVMTNVCANLVLVKFRQQYGLALFVRLVLIGYALTALIHLFVHGFWSALLIRAASGIAASGLVTLCILAMFQAMPGPKRVYAILIGISIPQLATPFARALAPALLEWGDWRMTYFSSWAWRCLPSPPCCCCRCRQATAKRRLSGRISSRSGCSFPALGSCARSSPLGGRCGGRRRHGLAGR
jgi:MFS family permease